MRMVYAASLILHMERIGIYFQEIKVELVSMLTNACKLMIELYGTFLLSCSTEPMTYPDGLKFVLLSLLVISQVVILFVVMELCMYLHKRALTSDIYKYSNLKVVPTLQIFQDIFKVSQQNFITLQKFFIRAQEEKSQELKMLVL